MLDQHKLDQVQSCVPQGSSQTNNTEPRNGSSTVDKATEFLQENFTPHRLTLNLIYFVNDVFYQSKEDSFKLLDCKTN